MTAAAPTPGSAPHRAPAAAPSPACAPASPRTEPSCRSAVLATLAAVGALCALLFSGALFRGEVLSQADFLLQLAPWNAVAPEGHQPGNPELSDQATQFQPWQMLLRESLARGELPLWNPRAGAGQPLLANLQSAVFSPFTWLALLFPFGTGLLVAAVAQLLCAGVGTALFARRLGASLPACVFAALAFTFGGFQFLWLQHPHAAVSCLLPWLLLLADVWAREPRVAQDGTAGSAATTNSAGAARPSAHVTGRVQHLRGPLLALGVAALIVCGHIETALHVALTVAAWSLFASAGRPWRLRLRLLSALAGWSLAGLALSGAQLLPFLEYLSLSESYAQRSGFQALWRRVPWDQFVPLLLAVLLLAAVIAACWRTLSLADRVAAPAPAAGSHGRAPRGRRLLLAAAWAGLACALGAVLLARLDAAGLSPLYRLLFHPDAFGHPVPARGLPFDGPRSYVNINNGYAGLVTLPLAFFALLCGPRGQRGVRALGWLWLAAFLLAYELPVASQLVNRLPVLNLALNYRFTLVVGFAAAVLGGLGLDVLRGALGRRRPVTAYWLLAPALAGALAFAPFVRGSPRGETRELEGADGARASVPVCVLELPADPVRAGELLPIAGWVLVEAAEADAAQIESADAALAAPEGGLPRALGRLPALRLEVSQLGLRRSRVVTAEQPGAQASPPPGAGVSGSAQAWARFAAELDTQGFRDGVLRVTVRAEGRVVHAEELAVVAPWRAQPRWWLLGAGTLLLLAWGSWSSAPPRPRSAAASRTALPVAALLLLGADLALFGAGVHPSAPAEHIFPDTPVTDFLRAQPAGSRLWATGTGLLPPNTAGVYGLWDLRGNDALGVERMALLREALRVQPIPSAPSAAPADDVSLGSSLADLLDLRFVLAAPEWSPPRGADFEPVFSAPGCRVWRNRRAPGRACFVREAGSIDAYLAAAVALAGEQPPPPEVMGVPEEALPRRRRMGVATAVGLECLPRWAAQQALLVEGAAAPMPAGVPRPALDGPPGGGEVRWIADEPQHQELLVRAESAGWLCVADTFYPGWEARVNGEPVQLVPAFFGLRAVRVPAGESAVSFDYDPASFRIGLLLSGAGALVVLAGAVLALRRVDRTRERR